jgi:hypothetical protein
VHHRATVAIVTAINTSAPRARVVASRLAIAASALRRRLAAVTLSVHRSRTSLANSTLQVGGLACFDVGAFQIVSPLGWAVTGASAFVLAWLLQPVGGS